MSELHPKGKFKAKKVGGTLAETTGGKAQAAILFRLESGIEKTWYGSFSDTKLKDGRSVAEVTIATLIKLGVDVSSWEGIEAESDIECMVTIEHRKNDKGEWNDGIAWVNFGDGLAVKKRLDDGAKAQLARKIAGVVAKVKADLSKDEANPF